MSDFTGYEEPSVPTKVRHIEIHITSGLVPEVDEYGVPTGADIEVERISARASVEDQNGIDQWVHSANDHTILLDKGVLTTTQLQNMRDFVQGFRDSIEAVLLPPVG